MRIIRLPIAWPIPRSLAWDGDDLVDWVGGGARWTAHGEAERSQVRYSYGFDRALVSPTGRYSVIYTERQTKGLVLDRGVVLREINRSFYQAENYAYPVALGCLPDGREVLAHCPNAYNLLELETLADGICLTQRETKGEDVFHSRLGFSPDGRHLISAGWVWHPWNIVQLFDIQAALNRSDALDRPAERLLPKCAGEVCCACWLDSDRVLVTTQIDDEGDQPEAESLDLPAGASGIWSVEAAAWIARSSDWNPQASLHACAGGALYVENGHPHWWSPGRDAPLAWPDITVVEAKPSDRGGIVFDSPLIAAHPTEPRFAAVTAEEIVIVTLP